MIFFNKFQNNLNKRIIETIICYLFQTNYSIWKSNKAVNKEHILYRTQDSFSKDHITSISRNTVCPNFTRNVEAPYVQVKR